MKDELWIVREGSRVWAYSCEENARAFHADLEPVRYVPALPATPCPGVTAQREKLQAEVDKLLGRGHHMWYALRCVADSQPGMTVAELRRLLARPGRPSR